jgi:hypothetical protein
MTIWQMGTLKKRRKNDEHSVRANVGRIVHAHISGHCLVWQRMEPIEAGRVEDIKATQSILLQNRGLKEECNSSLAIRILAANRSDVTSKGERVGSYAEGIEKIQSKKAHG